MVEYEEWKKTAKVDDARNSANIPEINVDN